jgi:exonuclease III
MSIFTKKSKLHISCWNINGFKSKGYNKYEDSRFLKEIKTKDIICLLETHCAQEESLILNGFSSVHLLRAKSKMTNKKSGGISVFFRSSLKPGIQFFEHRTNDYIWLILCSTFF